MSEQEEQPTSAKDRVFGFEEDLSSISVPDVLPVLPLRGVVVFPSAIVPLLISRGTSLKVVEHALAGDRMLALVAQKRPEDEAPAPEDLYVRGTAGRILKMLKYPDQSVRILVQGLRRIDLVQIVGTEPYYTARVQELTDAREPSAELEASQAHMVNLFAKFVSMIPYLPDELQVVAMNIKDAGKVTDLIAANLNVSLDEKQELLTQLKSVPSLAAQPKPTENAERTDSPTANEMMQRTLEAMRLEAQIAKDMDAYQKRPKRRFVGARAEEYRFARYVEDWRLKVERVGNLNYPEAARQLRLYGSLLITVSIRADGSVEAVEVNRSSGHRVLDAAAVRIVEMAAPYGAFPPDIRRDTDILHITRTWTFTRADELRSE